jgi:DNA-binding winged helix-turn-helix (wHTH) protein/TolB-like protein/Tfp pilus assembly protein PilF
MASLAENKKRQYSFGDVIVDRGTFCVIREGQARRLAPRAFDLLIYLMENADRVIEKRELFERVWKESFVTDSALTQAIKEVRRAIGDEADAPHYIMTIPKRGYRFIAPVNALPEEPPDLIVERHSSWRVAVDEIEEPDCNSAQLPTIARPRIIDDRRQIERWRTLKRTLVALSALGLAIAVFAGVLLIRDRTKHIDPSPGVHSIAVLPFKPISAEARDEVLELGIADNLIIRLSTVQQIAVRPTSAVRKYATLEQDPVAAGRELNAEAVLDGSVQRIGNRIRVTARLLRVGDGRALWAGEFDEQSQDMLLLQDSISHAVAMALLPRLSGEERARLARRYTQDPQAYELYQKGRYFWNKRTQDDLGKAIGYFNEAIARDPNYALAYSGLADSYALSALYTGLLSRDSFLKARSASDKALGIDPTLAEAQATRAYVKYYYEWDWAGAEVEFKRAIEMNPNYATAHQWYGEYLFFMERFDESLAQLNRARELDPLSLVINTELGSPYFYMRQYDRAAGMYRKALDMDPNFRLAGYCVALCYGQQGMYNEAIAALGGGRSVDAEVGYYFGVSGMRKEAHEMLDRLMRTYGEQYYSPYLISKVHVGLGEKDDAFAWLQKACENRDERIVMLKVDPDFDSLRSDLRFLELLRRVGLDSN